MLQPDPAVPGDLVLRSFCHVLKRTFQVLLALVGSYMLILLIGLIPINNDFAQTPGGVPVTVISNPVHADLVVPLQHPTRDWRQKLPRSVFQTYPDDARYIAFGWGDRGFYVETPTWKDLKLSTAAHALLMPSECCVHVQLIQHPNLPQQARTVTLSDQQYQRLVQCIDRSFTTDTDGRFIPIPNASYNQLDAFFRAKGNYHAFNTCNSWVGWCLRSAGVRAPILTPMPGSPTIYLPAEP